MLQAKKGKASSAPPLECVLGPGDWLYVPEGWYHGTINLEDSVAVSHQLGGVIARVLRSPIEIAGLCCMGRGHLVRHRTTRAVAGVGSGQALTPAHREWLAVWLLTGAGELAGGLAATERLIAIAPDSAEAVSAQSHENYHEQLSCRLPADSLAQCGHWPRSWRWRRAAVPPGAAACSIEASRGVHRCLQGSAQARYGAPLSELCGTSAACSRLTVPLVVAVRA